MSKFTVEVADNGTFYSTFHSSSDLVWQTPANQYNRKQSAIEAIASVARHFQMLFAIEFTDNTLKKPCRKMLYLEGNKIKKIEIIKDAKNSKHSR